MAGISNSTRDLRDAGTVSPHRCREQMDLEQQQQIFRFRQVVKDSCQPCQSWSAHQTKLLQPLKPTRQPLAVQMLNPKKEKHQKHSASFIKDAVTPSVPCLRITSTLWLCSNILSSRPVTILPRYRISQWLMTLMTSYWEFMKTQQSSLMPHKPHRCHR